jgi:lipase maturation factor 1
LILMGFQVLIILTGNYTFFNILAIALCLFWFDDVALRRFLPGMVRPLLITRSAGRPAAIAAAAVVLFLSVAHLWQTFTGRLPEVATAAVRYTAPLEIVNTYGLFAVMTTARMEISVEGSGDGQTWLPYEFRYKPGNLKQAPKWVAPLQPRLDWQMWFAALGSYRENIWFVNFCVRLLEGSPDVVKLLAANPFPGHAPKYVRATVSEYTFADSDTRRRTGQWWASQARGLYLPTVGLRGADGQ